MLYYYWRVLYVNFPPLNQIRTKVTHKGGFPFFLLTILLDHTKYNKITICIWYLVVYTFTIVNTRIQFGSVTDV